MPTFRVQRIQSNILGHSGILLLHLHPFHPSSSQGDLKGFLQMLKCLQMQMALICFLHMSNNHIGSNLNINFTHASTYVHFKICLWKSYVYSSTKIKSRGPLGCDGGSFSLLQYWIPIGYGFAQHLPPSALLLAPPSSPAQYS